MISESRSKLFNRMMSTLTELKTSYVDESSLAIQQRVLIMEEFRVSLRVGLFIPLGNEIRTNIIFIEADRRRKEVYFPAVDAEEGGLAYFRIKDLSDLRPGFAGMPEPTPHASRLRYLDTLNLLIVPGVAFDLHGGRMGFGKGYFDHCLEGFSGRRIALAYDFQIVSELPFGVRGRKVDWIVTEKRIIRCE